MVYLRQYPSISVNW